MLSSPALASSSSICTLIYCTCNTQNNHNNTLYTSKIHNDSIIHKPIPITLLPAKQLAVQSSNGIAIANKLDEISSSSLYIPTNSGPNSLAYQINLEGLLAEFSNKLEQTNEIIQQQNIIHSSYHTPANIHKNIQKQQAQQEKLDDQVIVAPSLHSSVALINEDSTGLTDLPRKELRSVLIDNLWAHLAGKISIPLARSAQA
jgi:hypothetical protein